MFFLVFFSWRPSHSLSKGWWFPGDIWSFWVTLWLTSAKKTHIFLEFFLSKTFHRIASHRVPTHFENLVWLQSVFSDESQGIFGPAVRRLLRHNPTTKFTLWRFSSNSNSEVSWKISVFHKRWKNFSWAGPCFSNTRH